MTHPYAGAPVSSTFRERWMDVRHQIHRKKPVGQIQVRKGRLNRTYHPYPGLGYPTFGEYPGVLGLGFWYPDWQVNSEWKDLDAVQNVKVAQDFTNNGIATLTLTMDNAVWDEKIGHAGALYHALEQGYYSPLRGYVAPKRPHPGVDKTEFFDFLPNAQIRVMQGYGEDEMVCTFLGLIDEVDTDSTPQTITITARDHGGVLVDEKFFGWAMEKFIQAPLTFAPRHLAENSQLVGGGAQASSTQDGFPASNVTLNDSSQWKSAVRDTPFDTEWVEIKVPNGKYSQIYLNVAEGMEAFIGIRPTQVDAPPGTVGGSSSFSDHGRFNGENIGPGDVTDGWYDPDSHSVPGGQGGWAYFRHIPATKGGGSHYISLGGVFETGSDTVLRVGFRNLTEADQAPSGSGGFGAIGYQAKVWLLLVNQREYKKNAVEGRYVIIDDLADIVRCCLRWCGFKGWEIEDAGTNLTDPNVADQSKTFMDMINMAAQQAGFNFFMGEVRDPDDDQDLGYPIFRNSRVLENYTGKTEFIDDRLLLTDAKVKVSNADDHCIIRCRGIAKNDGVGLGGDKVHRIMFAYIPPWAAEQGGHVAGVLKPLTHTDKLFTTVDDCWFGCLLIAIQVALSKYTAIIDLPANPGIGVDTLQSVIERNQGLNSRLYVSNRSMEMQFGQQGYWTMELGGSLVDTPDFVNVMKDYKAALKLINKGVRNPWLRKRKGKTLQYGYEDK